MKSIAFLALLPFPVLAQTFVGNLNGSSNDSIFETGGIVNTTITVGWEELSGNARVFDGSGLNGSIIHETDGFANYSVQYDTHVAIQSDTSYRLQMDLGFVAAAAGGNASYRVELGTLNGGVFTRLGSSITGTVNRTGNLATGSVSGTIDQTFATGVSVSGDNLAVFFAQTANSGQSDFFGFDRVRLTMTPIPEPKEYALVVGASLLGWIWFRQKRKGIASV